MVVPLYWVVGNRFGRFAYVSDTDTVSDVRFPTYRDQETATDIPYEQVRETEFHRSVIPPP